MKPAIKSTKTFTEQIDHWVIAGLRSDVRDFSSLLQRLPGIYPTEVANSLYRLLENRAVSESARDILIESESVASRFRGWRAETGLPIPHPLDYD